MNNAIVLGRLTRDPELRYLPGTGQAVCNFTLAVDKGLSKEKKQEMEAQGKATADFIDIVTWGKTAENVAQYTGKGLRVAVQGSIQTGTYTDNNGVKRKTFDINAYKVDFIDWKGSQDNQQNQQNYNQENYNQQNNIGVGGFHPVDDEDIPF